MCERQYEGDSSQPRSDIAGQQKGDRLELQPGLAASTQQPARLFMVHGWLSSCTYCYGRGEWSPSGEGSPSAPGTFW